MDFGVAAGYKSASQIARVVSEDWASRNLYCPSCNSDNLFQTPNNTKAYDFYCQSCRCFFQLKSVSRWNEKQIPDAGYESMHHAIIGNRTPNLFILNYNEMWTVKNLVLVPSFFFSTSAIQKRKPLGPSARRAGWIGCNILLVNIANSGKIKIIDEGNIIDERVVRARYNQVRPLSRISSTLRGWTLDVYRIVDKLRDPIFGLDDIYAFEEDLKKIYPQNKNIRPKIRQQLQVLRDLGLLTFTGKGKYSKIV